MKKESRAKIYAMSDIHGFLFPLDKALAAIGFNEKYENEEFAKNDDKLVFLGDYMDRGTNGYSVI